ncbi:lipoate--protein ligase [Acholeplasma vituli]|uniref:lipoate--protein ligase n=1 Tax=Paracholeplasma vituli TaxID=69473 RepID=A0ABT2PTW9_9MOLU|nr:lipoate--protein ligase [Paracholeplasma vituli]MCU0104396.1 lipoate--protein ligase [Paracholeplasma vituli]
MKYVNLSRFGRQTDPFFFALETILLEDLKEDLFFIWHVYGAVIIGKNQLLETEVNEAFLKENNIPVFRRLSGGGAVYSDEGCIKYSFLSKRYDKETIFKESLNHIKSVFDALEIPVVLSGRNDILYEGKKFSGNAYFHNQYGSCLHGTILYDTDFETLVKSITPSNEKLISKGIESVRQRVINMKPVVNKDIEDFTNFLVNHLTDGEYILSEAQIDRVFALMNKFSDEAYIKGNNPPYAFKHMKRFTAGSVGVKLDVHRGIIKDFILYGDYFTDKDPIELKKQFMNQPFEINKIESIIQSIDISQYIVGLTNEEFKSLFKEDV